MTVVQCRLERSTVVDGRVVVYTESAYIRREVEWASPTQYNETLTPVHDLCDATVFEDEGVPWSPGCTRMSVEPDSEYEIALTVPYLYYE